MSIQAQTMYVGRCDYPGCEVVTSDFDKGNHVVYDDPEKLVSAFAHRWDGGLGDWGWLAVGDKHYCGDHTTWDDDTDERVPMAPELENRSQS